VFSAETAERLLCIQAIQQEDAKRWELTRLSTFHLQMIAN